MTLGLAFTFLGVISIPAIVLASYFFYELGQHVTDSEWLEWLDCRSIGEFKARPDQTRVVTPNRRK